MSDLEELYTNVCFIFQNEKLLNQSVNEKLFDLDYIKVFTLVLAYLHLCDVPKDILELCLSGDLEEDEYKEIYEFLSNKWLNKANTEIEDLIYKIENGEEL